MGAEEAEQALIFTYGTLKHGFSNHCLLQDMMATGDASYLGLYITLDKLPLLAGPYRVPFLLNFPGSGHRVFGELYSVSSRALTRMDELEGTTLGHYERLPLKVEPADAATGGGGGGGERVVEAYYAHRRFAEEMWKKSEGGEKGCFNNYTEKEAKGYVKRKDRPQDLSFLDHIRLFLSS